MDRKFVTDLKKRRDNRLNAIYEKIKYFRDEACENKYIYSENCIKKSLKLFEKHLKHETISQDYERYSCDFLSISKENKNTFTEEIIENIREGMEIAIENNLKNLKKEFSERFLEEGIKHINEKEQDKYLSAVNLIVRMEKIRQIDELEDELHEISKDLISCIDYNNKIEAELRKVNG